MRSTLKSIWRLALPLCLTFVIQMVIIIVDSLFAGNISYTNLAAISLGGSAFYIFLLLLVGFEIGSSIRAGQAIGAEDEERMMHSFRQGILLCLVFGTFFTVLLLSSSPVLLALGQQPEVVELCRQYMVWFAWTLPVTMSIIMLRGYFAVIDQPWKSVGPIIFALFLNAGLNYCLAHGNLGFPNMGIAGIGLASLVSNCVMLVLMLGNVGWKKTQFLFGLFKLSVWKDRELISLFFISLPIGLTLVMEEAFFSGTHFLAGALGASEQAAHQILFNAVGTSYLFNTGIGMAVAIIIGKLIGAGQTEQILPVIKAGIFIVLACTFPFALVLGFFGDQWIHLFLDESLVSNRATILFAQTVMLIAIITLFLDGCFMVIIESLHGMLDTTFPAFAAFIAYWLIAGPLAYWATLQSEQAFLGIWLCILLSSTILVTLVAYRLHSKVKGYAV